MAVDPVDLNHVDLLDPARHTDGPPHELFNRLRSECPVHPGMSSDGQRYWSLTRDAEVREVNRDPSRFSSNRAGIFLHPDQMAPLELFRNMVLYKDPPQHSKYRRILISVFTPKVINRLEPMVRSRVNSVLDKVIESGRCDFVRDIAVPVPLGVLADLMGIPDDDIPKLYDWTQRIEESQRSPEPAAASATIGEMMVYLHELVERQVAEGGDSLVTRLRQAQVDGESLADDEILTFFGLLVFAGNDTTRNTAATGMLALLRHPEQWKLLREDPEGIPRAVEEILRYTSVIKWFARTATQDTELAGQKIQEGDKVLTWFASASLDEELNEEPQRFDITREKAEHRAFGGGGPHFCLGNGLARLELRVLFDELARRMPNLALDGPVEYLTSSWAHALNSMPIKFGPTSH